MLKDGFAIFGRYLAGTSILHRVDPRIKLVGVLVLVVAVFSSHQWLRLVLLAGVAAVLLRSGGIGLSHLLKAVQPLRWLLLFTLIIHVLLSPGHTLLGVPWLSRDGLSLGSLACIRLVLALLFSSFLTLTTSPAEVAGAVASLLRPLSRIGVSVHGFAVQILLVLHFIPILREEALAAFGSGQSLKGAEKTRSKFDRGRHLAQTAADMVLRLVARAEILAERISAGETAVIEPVSLPSPREWDRQNWIALGVVLPVIMLIGICT